MIPLSSLSIASKHDLLARVRVVATDIDGTLTRDARLPAEVLAAAQRLVEVGVRLLPVSGRPAGEVLGLCRYLPGVVRGLAENGLVEVVPDGLSRPLAQTGGRDALRDAAAAAMHAAGVSLVEAPDAFCRLADLAFERAKTPDDVLTQLQAHVAERGLALSWSTVHVHFSAAPPDKGRGVLALVGQRPELADLTAAEVVTIGDAPNDAGLFAPGRFGVTVGTADIVRHQAACAHLPEYLTDAREAEGFLELVAAVVAARRRLPV